MLSSPTLSELVDQARQKFLELHGRPPQWTAAAPGRVNLIGEHTDYNDGFVMPMAIERYVVMAGGRPREREDSTWQVYSDAVDRQATIDCQGPSPPTSLRWTSYYRGVLDEMQKLGIEAGPADVVTISTVPLGAGLSSSAALEVATATLVEAITGEMLDPHDKARLCQRVENLHVGVPCGIMDQFSSALCEKDRLMQLDCRTLETRHVDFTNPDLTVLLINSNVRRELASSAYPVRRDQCETAAQQLGVTSLRDAELSSLEKLRETMEEVLYRRARHVLTENRRVLDMANALATSDWSRVGELMYASNDSLRDDYEVSCKELNLLVDTAFEIGRGGGVIGSRLTGAGFGGCTITLVETDAVDQVASRIAKTYRGTTGIEPTMFTTRPAQGAHVVEG